MNSLPYPVSDRAYLWLNKGLPLISRIHHWSYGVAANDIVAAVPYSRRQNVKTYNPIFFSVIITPFTHRLEKFWWYSSDNTFTYSSTKFAFYLAVWGLWGRAYSGGTTRGVKLSELVVVFNQKSYRFGWWNQKVVYCMRTNIENIILHRSDYVNYLLLLDNNISLG